MTASGSPAPDDPGPAPGQEAGQPEYPHETGQAAAADGTVAAIIGGLPAVEGSAWDTGAALADRGGRAGGGPGSPEGLARDFMAGLTDGDTDRMRAALHPDATWSVPGATGISGVAAGADAIIARARAITSGGDVSIELRYVLHGLADVAVLLHNTGQRGGTRLDQQVVIMFTLSGGKIAAAANLISDVPGLNAFFAAGT